MQHSSLDRRSIALLSFGHMLTDVNSGAIPALLPFLVLILGSSYLSAAGLVLAATLISSIVQPLLGFYSDRHPTPWLIPLGLSVSGLGLAAVGFASSYPAMIGLMLITGAGVATFHPESFRFANYVSGKEQGRGISLFSVGGNAGFAIGPLFMTAAVLAFGLQGTLFLAFPAVLMALALWHELPRLERFRPPIHEVHRAVRGGEDQWSPFVVLVGVIILRSALNYSLLSFAPLFFAQVHGFSIGDANRTLTYMSLAGMAGTLVGGYLTDKLGIKQTVFIPLLALIPVLAAIPLVPPAAAVICLILVGLTLAMGGTAVVVMGQSFAPRSLGLASGITTGLAIGLGGLAAPLVGALADQVGLALAFRLLVFLPIVAAVIALALPPQRRAVGQLVA